MSVAHLNEKNNVVKSGNVFNINSINIIIIKVYFYYFTFYYIYLNIILHSMRNIYIKIFVLLKSRAVK